MRTKQFLSTRSSPGHYLVFNSRNVSNKGSHNQRSWYRPIVFLSNTFNDSVLPLSPSKLNPYRVINFRNSAQPVKEAVSYAVFISISSGPWSTYYPHRFSCGSKAERNDRFTGQKRELEAHQNAHFGARKYRFNYSSETSLHGPSRF